MISIRYSLFKLFLFVLCLIFLGSCRLQDDSPPTVSGGESFNVAAQTCSFNGEVMEQFFKIDISKDLDCLKQNLDLYAKVNQVNDPDVLNEEELTKFLANFFKNSQSLEKGVRDLFTLAHFVLDSPRGLIPVAHIDDLIEILKVTNRHGRVLVHIFDDLKFKDEAIPENIFWQHREQIAQSSTLLANEILTLISAHGNPETSYGIEDLLEMAWAQKNKELIEDIRALLFSKVLVVGGNQDTVTRSELVLAMKKLPSILVLTYEMVGGFKVPFETEKDIGEIILSSSRLLKSLLHHEDGRNEAYFKLEKIIETSHHFSRSMYDLTPLRKSLTQIFRSSIFHGENDWVDYRALSILLKYVEQVSERIVRFSDLWELNEMVLNRPELSKREDILFPPTTDEVMVIHDLAFLRLATSHPFFLGRDKIPTYGRVLKRDRRGIIETGVFDYLLRVFLSAHVAKKDRMEQSEFFQIVLNYDDFLTEMKLWRNPPEKMVRSNFLMADLFRQVSTPDGIVDTEEVLSTIVMDLASFRIADQIFPQIFEHCRSVAGCEINETLQGIPTSFFYQNFFQYFEEHKARFPEVYKQIVRMNPTQRTDYMKNLARFTRHCPFDGPQYEVPIRHKDIVLIMGGLISIEETYLMMDQDFDSILNFDELEQVANRFRRGIIDFAKLTPETEFLARSIFFYLVVNQRLPAGQTEILAFHYTKLPFMNKAKIKLDRVGVAKLVSFFSTPDEVPHTDCSKAISRPENEFIYTLRN